MTRKEWVEEHFPDAVDAESRGGVVGCPCHYEGLTELDANINFNDCYNYKICADCWNAEINSTDDKIAPADDKVNHPLHYCKGGIECIQAIKASMTADGFMDYCKGNIIKYLWRWRDKGGIEDLHKAKVYLDWLIEAAKGE